MYFNLEEIMKIIKYLFYVTLLTCTAHPMNKEKITGYYVTNKKKTSDTPLFNNVFDSQLIENDNLKCCCIKIGASDENPEAQNKPSNACKTVRNCCIGAFIGSGVMACYCCCLMTASIIIYLKFRLNL